MKIKNTILTVINSIGNSGLSVTVWALVCSGVSFQVYLYKKSIVLAILPVLIGIVIGLLSGIYFAKKSNRILGRRKKKGRRST